MLRFFETQKREDGGVQVAIREILLNLVVNDDGSIAFTSIDEINELDLATFKLLSDTVTDQFKVLADAEEPNTKAANAAIKATDPGWVAELTPGRQDRLGCRAARGHAQRARGADR